MKNIVLCSDGTGQRGGAAQPTNVWRAYLAIDPHPADGPQQIRFHDDGVGSGGSRVARTLGGAFGWGISRNVSELYASLIFSYQPGDRIFLFGFSRGAYTVRVLAQLICLFGVPDAGGKSPREIRRIAKAALDAYKNANREHHQEKRSQTAEKFCETYGNVHAAHTDKDEFYVHFLGCWDTVSALGLPFDELTKALESIFPLAFRNAHPHSGIHHLYHALSLDDERHTFHPAVWDGSQLAPGQTLEQVWFPGAHSNVGGGYAKDQVALVCLNWMLDRAADHGLKLHDHVLLDYRGDASVHGKVYESRAALRSYYRYRPRRVNDLMPDQATPRIHAGTLERIGQQTDGYAPTSITVKQFDTAGATDFNESPEQQQWRYQQTEKAHDFITLRRVLYYLFLAWTAALIGWGWRGATGPSISPLIPPPEAPGGGLWRLLLNGWYSLERLVLDGLDALLPGFVDWLVKGYAQAPGAASVMFLLLVALFWISSCLTDLIRESATRAWHGRPQGVQPPPRGVARAAWYVRSCRMMLKGFSLPTNAVLHGLAALVGRVRPTCEPLAANWRKRAAPVLGSAVIIAAVILLLVWLPRFAWLRFHRYELDTQVPAPAAVLDAGEVHTLSPATRPFDTRVPYFATGVFLERGRSYRVQVTSAGAWQDASLPASPEGIKNADDEQLVHRWLRREPRAPLFSLMAAIGPRAEHRIAIGRDQTFTAPVSGALYLFVNDVPGFYYNNRGTATVRITRTD